MQIPTIFHRIWLGGKPMPQNYVLFGKSWLHHNPGWTMTTWDHRPSWLHNQQLFDTAETYSEQSDIWRYEILLKYGGVYVDTDYECRKNIGGLLDYFESLDPKLPIIATDAEKWQDDYPCYMNPALMGCSPGHPLMREVVDKLPAWALAHRAEGPCMSTGPGYITYNFQGRLFPVAQRVFNGEYAVHHLSGSWGKPWGKVKN